MRVKLSGVVIAVVAATCGLAVPLVARADSGANSFCARLSTETTPDCVPVERGPQAAWDQAAAKWKPGPLPSLPLVALWATPGVALDDIAHNKELLLELKKRSEVARAFVETKNAESVLASLKAQLQVFDQIRAKQKEQTPSP